jgi:hypothetical protein
MRIFSAFAVIFILAFVGCDSDKTPSNKLIYFDLPAFVSKEIASYQSRGFGLRKNINKDDKISTIELDTVQWKEELAPYLAININSNSLENKYNISIDSNKNLSITKYTALDTNLEISEIAVTKVNQNIQLIEAKTRKRSFVVDRDIHFSFMPGKGYGMLVNENYIWSSPKKYEIFAEINNKKEIFR